jgi:hypothetical protein
MSERPKNPYVVLGPPGIACREARAWNECAAAYEPLLVALGRRVAELEAERENLGEAIAATSATITKQNARMAELEAHHSIADKMAVLQDRIDKTITDNVCTPAERRVLEAMARVPTEHLEDVAAFADPEEACAAKAELARRKEEQS